MTLPRSDQRVLCGAYDRELRALLRVTIAGLTGRFNGPTSACGEVGSSRDATLCGDDAIPNNPEPRHNKLVRSNIPGHARNMGDRQPRWILQLH